LPALTSSITNTSLTPVPYSASTPVATPITLSGLLEGSHTISVIGETPSGTWQSTLAPTTYSWTVDLTGPTISLISPDDNDNTVQQTDSFSWTGTDALSGVASYQLTVDNTTGSAITDTSVSLPNLACNQEHTWHVTATDNVGNTTNSATRKFSIPCGAISSSFSAPIITSSSLTPTPSPATSQTISSTSNPTPASGLTTTQITSILSLLASFGADTATMANVQTALGGTTVTNSSQTTTYTFTRNLSLHDTGADVQALQQFLNTHGFLVAASGPGSQSNETTTFGTKTYAALIKYQKSVGLPGTGWFGPMTRRRINGG